MRGQPSQTSASVRPCQAQSGISPPSEGAVSNLLRSLFVPGGLRNPKAKPRKNRRCETATGRGPLGVYNEALRGPGKALKRGGEPDGTPQRLKPGCGSNLSTRA